MSVWGKREPISDDLMAVIDVIHGLYQAEAAYQHIPATVVDEQKMADALRPLLRVEHTYVSVEGKPRLVASELKALQDKVAELLQRVQAIEHKPEPKPAPEPKPRAPWVDASPEDWGQEITFRWPGQVGLTSFTFDSAPTDEQRAEYAEKMAAQEERRETWERETYARLKAKYEEGD